jgi:hypothetical protein
MRLFRWVCAGVFALAMSGSARAQSATEWSATRTERCRRHLIQRLQLVYFFPPIDWPRQQDARGQQHGAGPAVFQSDHAASADQFDRSEAIAIALRAAYFGRPSFFFGTFPLFPSLM